MPPLIQALDAGILTLTLNRAGQRNRLNAELIEAIHQALERAELDADVRVVAVRGAGDDFCAGMDLDELAASGDRTLAENEQSALRFGRVLQRIRELPKPVVAGVQGRVLGAGAALASACDVVLAAEYVEIGCSEVAGGMAPVIGMTLLRRSVGEKLALDLAFTGRTLGAMAAQAAGLITRAVPDDELDVEVAASAKVLAAASGSALALVKALTYRLDGLSLEDGLALEARASALARGHSRF